MNKVLWLSAITLILLSLCLAVRLCEADEIDDLVPFVIQVESSGNPNAVSKAGCIGLMQISPIVLEEYKREHNSNLWRHYNCSFHQDGIWKELDIFDMYETAFNIEVGTWYLKRLRDHYLKSDYTIERMLASYNGGITRMRRLLREGKDWQDMPRESVNYVRKVLKLYKEE